MLIPGGRIKVPSRPAIGMLRAFLSR